MSRKLLLFGGLSVASIATITPTGIHFQKESHKRKDEKAREDRQKFIDRFNVAVNKLNGDSTNISNGLSFLKDSSEDDDKGKLMGIWDVLAHYSEIHKNTGKTYNRTFSFSKEEMNQDQKNYGEDIVTNKKEKKGEGKATKERLDRANKKSKEYWEKFKEMCLILIENDQIKEENLNPANDKNFLCVFGGTILKGSGEEYQKSYSSKLGVMEYFGTVYFKGKRSK